MRMIIQSRLIVFLDYECGQQLQEHQKCCRQSGRNDRMSIKGIYDIHCHIVPGVDDGATDIGETVKLLRMEYEQGVRTVIATPHFRFRMFETPAEKVREQFRLVEKAASEISPDLHVYLGCEFHANMEMLPMLREVAYGKIKQDIADILSMLCKRKGVKIVEAEICPDHVHMLVEIPPSISVSYFVGYLKGKSTLMIFERHANLKYKYGNRHFWCRGYYVDTVGKNAKKIQEYIANQLQDDLEYDQMTLKEYIDPFTGEPVKRNK